ncbi:MAG: hypothetical protein AB7S50_08220 [Bacteroidales bacterium]
MELFNNLRWDSLDAQFFQWVNPIPARYCELLNDNEKKIHKSILEDYPQINRNELAFIIGWVKSGNNYMNIGFDNQKNIANDILEAKKLVLDKTISSITVNGKHPYKFRDTTLVKQVIEQIIDRTNWLEKQLHTEYIIKEEEKKPKNFFIKNRTIDFYNTLIKRYKLGKSQSMYVIGEIYACLGIYLNEPILTKDQFENKKDVIEASNYKQYLHNIIKSFLNA